MSIKVVLYTGSHCHLCDQAKALIYPLLTEYMATLQEVNIAGDPELQATYGTRIPVIQFPDGEEKGWPFTAGQVRKMFASFNNG